MIILISQYNKYFSRYEGYTVKLDITSSLGYTATTTLEIAGDKVVEDKQYICEVSDTYHTAISRNTLRTFSMYHFGYPLFNY